MFEVALLQRPTFFSTNQQVLMHFSGFPRLNSIALDIQIMLL